LKVIDYGLARILKEDEKRSTICGTPEYQAPEMLRGEKYDKNVDWWALGILLYEMKFGFTPFYNSNKLQLLARIKLKILTFPDRNKYAI
jgi:serum/glucocorticoid-regulated kinase 2